MTDISVTSPELSSSHRIFAPFPKRRRGPLSDSDPLSPSKSTSPIFPSHHLTTSELTKAAEDLLDQYDTPTRERSLHGRGKGAALGVLTPHDSSSTLALDQTEGAAAWSNIAEHDCEKEGCYDSGNRYSADDDRMSDDYAARGGGKKRKVPASAQQGPGNGGGRDEHSCGHSCGHTDGGGDLSGDGEGEDPLDEHGDHCCHGDDYCCEHHSVLRGCTSSERVASGKPTRLKLTPARRALAFEKRLLAARQAQVLGLHSDARTCLAQTKQSLAALPTQEELESLTRALEYAGVASWEGDRVGSGAGIWEGQAPRSRNKMLSVLQSTLGERRLTASNWEEDEEEGDDAEEKDVPTIKLAWRRRGRARERWEWIHRDPVARKGWMPEGSFEFEMRSPVSSIISRSQKDLAILRSKVTQLLTLTLSSPPMTNFLHANDATLAPPSITNDPPPPPPSIGKQPAPPLSTQTPTPPYTPEPPTRARISGRRSPNAGSSGRKGGSPSPAPKGGKAGQALRGRVREGAKPPGTEATPLQGQLTPPSSQQPSPVAAPATPRPAPAPAAAVDAGGAAPTTQSTPATSPAQAATSTPAAASAPANKARGNAVTRKEDVKVEPSADVPDYVPPPPPPSKKKGKKKKKAANASNPHHVRNYVLSRRPAGSSAKDPSAASDFDNPFYPPPTRFLASRPQLAGSPQPDVEPPFADVAAGADVDDADTSSSAAPAPASAPPAPNDPAEPPPVDEEYICCFCEYDLFFGSSALMYKGVRRRKKLLEKRTRASEKAKGVLEGKGLGKLKGGSKKAGAAGTVNKGEPGCPGGDQCRCNDIRAERKKQEEEAQAAGFAAGYAAGSAASAALTAEGQLSEAAPTATAADATTQAQPESTVVSSTAHEDTPTETGSETAAVSIIASSSPAPPQASAKLGLPSTSPVPSNTSTAMDRLSSSEFDAPAERTITTATTLAGDTEPGKQPSDRPLSPTPPLPVDPADVEYWSTYDLDALD